MEEQNMVFLQTKKVVLTNDFFVNLTDMNYFWKPVGENLYNINDRKTGANKMDSNTSGFSFWFKFNITSLCEVYAQDETKKNL